MTENQIATQIVDAAYRTHVALGPGLFEAVYEKVFAHELTKRGLNFQRQHPIPLTYEGINLEAAFRADLIVEDKIILEIKAVESLNPLFKTQLRTYLRLANKRLGFLINFNGILLKNKIIRVVNQLPDDPAHPFHP